MNYAEVLAVAVTLFFVMDPLGNIPVFNAVLSRFAPRVRSKIVARELVIALAILLFFLGAWHYVAATFNGAVTQIYGDGNNVTMLSAITPVVAGTAPLSIGRNGAGAYYFGGLIDEVRISNVRRSDAWIATQRRSTVGSLVTFH